MPSIDERERRYAEAMHWAPLGDDFQRAVRAVMAVADAEQQAVASENERLSLEVERLRRNTAGLYERAHAAEAKVARVEAAVSEWEKASTLEGLSRSAGQTTRLWCATDLRRAMKG